MPLVSVKEMSVVELKNEWRSNMKNYYTEKENLDTFSGSNSYFKKRRGELMDSMITLFKGDIVLFLIYIGLNRLFSNQFITIFTEIIKFIVLLTVGICLISWATYLVTRIVVEATRKSNSYVERLIEESRQGMNFAYAQMETIKRELTRRNINVAETEEDLKKELGIEEKGLQI